MSRVIETSSLLTSLDEDRDLEALEEDDHHHDDFENLRDPKDDTSARAARIDAIPGTNATIIRHNLDMGVATRSGSILSGDKETADEDGEFQRLWAMGDDVSVVSLGKDKVDPRSRPFFTYLLLLMAVVSLSSIGPLLILQDDATPTMKVVWRMTGTSILLLPVTAHDVYTHGFPKLSWQAWATFLLATISYSVMTLSFVISLTYTTVGNAVVLANSLPLILLVGKLLVGQPITWMSGCGALVAFGGTALCSKDSAENRWDGSSTLLGDGLAIISAFAGVGYLVFAKSSRSHMSMYLFMFLTMALGAGISWIFQIVVLGETSTFDMDYHHGLWGFLLPVKGRLPLESVIVVVCNLCGTMGYVRVMQYFDNLVISSAALMEPVIAEFLSFGFGVGALPGLYGWIGNALVAGGTFAVLYKDAQETKSEAHIELS